MHALVARRLIGPEGRVVAIDPQPYNCARILANCRLNDFANILTIVAAAGDRDTVTTLHDQSIRDKSRLTLTPNAVNEYPFEFQVPMVRLDRLLEELELTTVKLLKIDVEGFEPEVLMGLGSHIEGVQNVILEVLPESAVAPGTGTMLDSLRNRGFELRTVEGDPLGDLDELPEHNLWASRQGTA